MPARRRWTRTRVLVSGTVLLAGAWVGPSAVATTATPQAAAPSADELTAAAGTAREVADDLVEQLADAAGRWQRSLDAVTAGAAFEHVAGRTEREAARRHAAADRRQRDHVRAVYMTGGAPTVYAGLLAARSPHDLALGWQSTRRLLTDGARAVEESEAAATDAAEVAAAADEAVTGTVATARDVERELVALQDLLARAQEEAVRLAAAAEEARRAEQAQAAADATAAAERILAAAQAAQAAQVGPVAQPAAPTGADGHSSGGAGRSTAPRPAPAEYDRLYRAAAATCPGLPWTVVSAIGQVETGHGANVAVSSAGALGPMQFMPGTWAAYGVDGDGDGDRDVWDPTDAVFGAANYLCASGGGVPERLPRAVWHYNHAQWYVDLVLGIAYRLDPASLVGVPRSPSAG